MAVTGRWPHPAFAGVLRALAGAVASTTNQLTLEMVGTPTLPRGKTPTDGTWQDDCRYPVTAIHAQRQRQPDGCAIHRMPLHGSVHGQSDGLPGRGLK
jgi:hypothetical protein